MPGRHQRRPWPRQADRVEHAAHAQRTNLPVGVQRDTVADADVQAVGHVGRDEQLAGTRRGARPGEPGVRRPSAEGACVVEVELAHGGRGLGEA